MTVAVLPNLDKPGCSEVVEKLAVILKNEGITAYIPDTIVAAGFTPAPEEEIFKLADVIITIGGDGTILQAAFSCAKKDIPILGINLGRIGFMNEVEVDEIEDAVKSLFSDDFII